jgi:hypothetical protein
VQLVVLVVVLAAVLYWRFGGTTPAPEPAAANKPKPASAEAQPSAQRTKQASTALPSPLNFAKLEQVPQETTAARNPFQFYTPPPPPPPPRPAAPPPPPQPVYVPPVDPGPPPISLKFIGKFQQNGVTVAMLTDGKSQFSAAEGGIIDGRYRVVKIGLESVQIEYVNGKGRTTLPFRG